MIGAPVIYIAIVACLVGLGTATYIHKKKKTKTKLVCPLRANCDKVIYSTHATSFGIPNELLGIGYYVVLGLLYALSYFQPAIFANAITYYIIVLLTSIGVIFSLYLIAVQAVVIKAWCSWCMLSAFANFVLVWCMIQLPSDLLFQTIASHRTIWVIVHNIGFILGLGSATIADIFFFRFLKDHQISEEEKGTFDALTNIIWVGLGILVLSGTILYLPAQERLGESAKFLLKMSVLGIIILNGIALNLFVAPRMRQLSFESTKPARNFRRLAFALGAVSLTSWYTAFLLGSVRSLGVYSFTHGVVGYLVIIIGAVVGSQIFERIMVHKYHALPENQGS